MNFTSIFCMGPCTYDVRTEGGGGFKNCPILWTDSTDRLREMQTRGREGVQNPKKFADVLYDPSRRGWRDSATHTLFRAQHESGREAGAYFPKTTERGQVGQEGKCSLSNSVAILGCSHWMEQQPYCRDQN